MQLEGSEDERAIEAEIVNNIRKFILGLGKGFAFLGNQFRLEVDGQEFFIDLLFYNRHLQCLVAFELKRGKFKPEYAGQLNFYLNVLDDMVKLPNVNPSIGIILCKEKSNTIESTLFDLSTMEWALLLLNHPECTGRVKKVFTRRRKIDGSTLGTIHSTPEDNCKPDMRIERGSQAEGASSPSA